MPDEREVNLLGVKPKKRDYSHPVTPVEMEVLGRFNQEYFESPFTHGYNKYEYTGLYRAGAKKLIDFYSLPDSCRILDVGCAKGFLLYDLKELRLTGLIFQSMPLITPCRQSGAIWYIPVLLDCRFGTLNLIW